MLCLVCIACPWAPAIWFGTLTKLLVVLPLIAIFAVATYYPAAMFSAALVLMGFIVIASMRNIWSAPLLPSNRQIAVGVGIAMVISVAISLLVRTFLLQTFYVPSSSIAPTLPLGKHVIVEKRSILTGTVPSPGDIVVYRQDDQTYLKRLVALGGDRVKVDVEGQVFVNGVALDRVDLGPGQLVEVDNHGRTETKTGHRLRECIGDASYEIFLRDNEQRKNFGTEQCGPPLRNRGPKELTLQPDGSCLVPDGYFFSLGDNRDNSLDARYVGASPLSAIMGRVVFSF
jgi:signal peptidase I